MERTSTAAAPATAAESRAEVGSVEERAEARGEGALAERGAAALEEATEAEDAGLATEAGLVGVGLEKAVAETEEGLEKVAMARPKAKPVGMREAAAALVGTPNSRHSRPRREEEGQSFFGFACLARVSASFGAFRAFSERNCDKKSFRVSSFASQVFVLKN